MLLLDGRGGGGGSGSGRVFYQDAVRGARQIVSCLLFLAVGVGALLAVLLLWLLLVTAAAAATEGNDKTFGA